MNTRLLRIAIITLALTASNTFGIILAGFTTQTWNFETQQTDNFNGATKTYNIAPDTYVNPFGTPSGTFSVTSYYRDSGWFTVHNSQNGVLYGDKIEASIDIPNISDLDKSKEVCISVHCMGNIQLTAILITPEYGSSAVFNNRTITYETPDILPEESWATLKEYWIITPQPNFENIGFTFQRGGTDVDSITIETKMLPEINSYTLFAFGGLTLAARNIRAN
jgi:hypothetical protein